MPGMPLSRSSTEMSRRNMTASRMASLFFNLLSRASERYGAMPPLQSFKFMAGVCSSHRWDRSSTPVDLNILKIFEVDVIFRHFRTFSDFRFGDWGRQVSEALENRWQEIGEALLDVFVPRILNRCYVNLRNSFSPTCTFCWTCDFHGSPSISCNLTAKHGNMI